MYKKAMSSLVLVYLLFLFGVICVRGVERNKLDATAPAQTIKVDEKLLAEEEKNMVGITQVAASGQRIVDCNTVEQDYRMLLDEEELDILLRIVEAEAGCEDEEGKLLVANVVLNRVESEDFPDTVSEVVFQKEKGVTQFSPVSNGKIWTVKVSDETVDAVERALKGEDISDGALYFAARKYADDERMKWFDDNLVFLFEHGGHEFFCNSSAMR